MPQDPQAPLGPRRVRFPDGTVKTYPPGTTNEQIRAELAVEWDKQSQPINQLQSATGLQAPGGMRLSDAQAGYKGMGDDAMKYGGMGLALASGLAPAPLLLKMIGAAAGGGIEALGRGEDPGEGAMFEGGMEAAFGGIGHVAPRAGLRLGMALGGVRGETKEAADAFMRERARTVIPGTRLRNPLGPVLGQGPRVQETVKDVAQELRAVEDGFTGHITGQQLRGATDESVNRAKAGLRPVDAGADLRGVEEAFLKQQAVIQGLKAYGIDPSMLTKAQFDWWKKAWPRISDSQVNLTKFNGRELGNIRRAARAEAEPIIQTRLRKEQVIPGTESHGVAAEAIYRRAKELQDAAIPEVVPINNRLKDLLTMTETNRSLRGGGGVIGDTGQMAVRAGLGHGLSHSIANVSGNTSAPLAQLGGWLGLAGLNPKAISQVGNQVGNAAEAVPTLQRMFGPSASEEEDRDIFSAVKKLVTEGAGNNPDLADPTTILRLFGALK